MIPGSSVRQFFKDINDYCSKFQESFLQIINPRHWLALAWSSLFVAFLFKVQGFGVQGSRFRHLTPVPPAIAASVFAARPNGPAHGPPPYPRPARWFWG